MLIKENESIRLAWERSLGSTLTPLKYCLQSIRGEFLRLADTCELFLVISGQVCLLKYSQTVPS